MLLLYAYIMSILKPSYIIFKIYIREGREKRWKGKGWTSFNNTQHYLITQVTEISAGASFSEDPASPPVLG